jgi:hypothetical protein
MTDRSSETAAKLPSANDIKLINEARQKVVTSSKDGLEHAIECGEMLNAAKKKVGHGDWQSWLKQHCPDIKPRTATYYMRFATNGENRTTLVLARYLSWVCSTHPGTVGTVGTVGTSTIFFLLL